MNLQVRLAGVSFDNRQENIRLYTPEITEYEMKREPENPHDFNAIRVCAGVHGFGYIPAVMARDIAPVMDAGKHLIARYVCLNGSPYHDTVGLTIRICEVDDDYRMPWQH